MTKIIKLLFIFSLPVIVFANENSVSPTNSLDALKKTIDDKNRQIIDLQSALDNYEKTIIDLKNKNKEIRNEVNELKKKYEIEKTKIANDYEAKMLSIQKSSESNNQLSKEITGKIDDMLRVVATDEPKENKISMERNAKFYFENDLDNEAIELYQQLYKNNSQHLDYLLKLSESYIRLGKYDDASIWLTKEEKIDKNNSTVKRLVGMCKQNNK